LKGNPAFRLQQIHGHTTGHVLSPEYRAWADMKGRCLNPNDKDWVQWGGRGITVCSEWADPHGFPAFLAYIGLRPGPDYSLDRIDVNGNYEPGNVRWATRSEQQRNKRPTSRAT